MDDFSGNLCNKRDRYGHSVKKNEGMQSCSDGYIDLDDEQIVEENKEEDYSQWSDLPDLLLEEVFSYLTIRERYYASLVCRNWYRGFHLPRIWSTFPISDRTLTRTIYNYYSGWNYILDHLRTQNCLTSIGKYMHGLDFKPQHSFNNLFQFMTLLTWYIDKADGPNCHKSIIGIGRRIKRLSYLFPCNQSVRNDPEGVKLFGTGGELLCALKKLLSRLPNLRELKLIDLVLDRYEANHLLDEVLITGCEILRVLYLVNVTTVHCPILHVGLFLNLRILVISPQNIDDTILELISNLRLKHLHLLQNRYTPSGDRILPCSAKAWKNIRSSHPKLKVHLRVEAVDYKDFEVVFQPFAPVYSVVYQTPSTKMKPELMVKMLDHYRGTLSVYGHEMLPRFVSEKSFSNRMDSMLVMLVRQCVNLTTLVIREKISTSTVLLLARLGQNLRHFYVRRFAVILRCDWPKNPDWSDEFYGWLRRSCRSYEETEKEVSQILDQQWKFLSDANFKKIEINPRCC